MALWQKACRFSQQTGRTDDRAGLGRDETLMQHGNPRKPAAGSPHIIHVTGFSERHISLLDFIHQGDDRIDAHEATPRFVS